MATPFAAAELRLGRAVAARLANATASFGGGAAVSGIFDNSAEVVGLGSIGQVARQPRFAAPAASVAGVAKGDSVVVTHPAAGAGYVVAYRQPDELHTGWVTFLLEAAA
jgi:hypothetical protein